jgi:RNA polymerase sigma factor (sigma-70 family)
MSTRVPPEQGFEQSFDRAAERDRDMRGQLPSGVGGASTGLDVDGAVAALGRSPSTDDVVTDLAARTAAGDASARTALVEQCLPMIFRVARRYAGGDLEIADLVQEGVIGVVRAVDRFDASRGVPFAAYASWWLRQSMQQAIAEQSRAVRLPTHVLRDIHSLREARGDVLAATGRTATSLQLEHRLDWTQQHLEDVRRAELPALSMDAAYAGDEGAIDSLGDLIADPLSEQAYEDVITGGASTAIRSLFSTLTDRERQVLAWRFGLDGEELSLRQIARKLGVSAERVRQIEHRGLIKLRVGALPDDGA